MIPPSVRLPKNHQLVLGVVRSQGPGVHATTIEIFAAAKRRQPGIGYSTVYRGLTRLRDCGLILEVAIPGTASVVYEPAAVSHAHFHCCRCGRIEDVAFTLPRATLTRIEDASRHQITGTTLTFHGLCRQCRTETDPSPAAVEGPE
ncbi:MAG: Fur family transcriptional regulator [Stellaceae bacterium]